MAKARQFRLLLVRSGETQWDREGRLGGCVDLPLCDAGRAEAAGDLATAGPFGVTHAFAGDDEASEDSARLLAPADVGVKRLGDLREVGLGLWEGSRIADLEERSPTAFKRWSEDPTSATPPEGESVDEAAERLWRQLGRLAEKVKSPDAVVVIAVRPLAWGVLECLLSGRSLSELWTVLRGSPRLVVHDLDASALRDRPAPIPVRSS